MPTKQNTEFEQELDEAVRKGRWIPLGGFKVAVIIVIVLTIFIGIGAPFLPQMIQSGDQPFQYAPQLETYPPAEEDPRRIAWVGNDDFIQIIYRFSIDIALPVHHTKFPNCSTLLYTMYTEGYRAHLYVMSPETVRNQAVGRDGIIYDPTLLMNYNAADCGALVREVHRDAKILCLVSAVNSYVGSECLDEGFFLMTPEEAVSEDALETEFKMTIAESTIRNLIELPINPDSEDGFPSHLPDDW